jgi:PAS domain-containing protein
MPEQGVQRSDQWWSDQRQRPEASDDSAAYAVRVRSVPGGLLPRACHALPWGILVVSARGLVSYYNRAYARLRGLPPGAFLGHPIEALDRRHRLRELLHTGVLPAEHATSSERRTNREIILPLWEERQLIGVLVVVIPAAERLEGGEGCLPQQLSDARRRRDFTYSV